MVVKKLFSFQNLMKKLFETHYSLKKNCLKVPKMVTLPPPPPDKNNGLSLIKCAGTASATSSDNLKWPEGYLRKYTVLFKFLEI